MTTAREIVLEHHPDAWSDDLGSGDQWAIFETVSFELSPDGLNVLGSGDSEKAAWESAAEAPKDLP